MPRPSAVIEAVEARLLFSTFVVRTTADSGPDSLRAAILAANANDAPGAPVDDDIVFALAPAGQHTINLLSPLPEITGNVTIDATTQPGYADNYTPVVELNGQGAGAGADGLRIASTDPFAASNVLGLIVNGFAGNGIVISGNGNSVAQCYIGADESGAAAGPGNGGHGVLVTGGQNLIEGNVIAFNLGDGVAVSAGSVGNIVSPNAFFSNGGLGIDLGDDGPTPNDATDADDGANHRQNYPVITSVTPAAAPATGLRVTGTIDTTPGALVQVVLYVNSISDGGGRSFVELQPFEVDASGDGTFTANLPSASATDWVTATATSYLFTGETSDVNTSEFSPAAKAESGTSVAAVYVRGSTWAGPDFNPALLTFKEYLEAKSLGDDVYGFRVDGDGAQAVLPWINMDQIVLRYASAPTGASIPTPSHFSVTGEKGGYSVNAVTPVEGDASAFVLTLNKPLGGGNPATAAAPTPQENGDRVTITVPGGGPAGANYALRMNVLQGDADHTGETAAHAVLANDYAEVKSRFFKTTSSPTGTTADYSAFHDVNGDGSILANDFSEVKKRFFQTLAPPPAAPASIAAAGITHDVFSRHPIL